MVYQSIPEACLAARAKRGHTQEDAAAVVGRSLRTWKSWEHGEATPNAKHLMPLASYLGVRLTDLVRLVQHEGAPSAVAAATPVEGGAA